MLTKIFSKKVDKRKYTKMNTYTLISRLKSGFLNKREYKVAIEVLKNRISKCSNKSMEATIINELKKRGYKITVEVKYFIEEN